jgi:hypothetical protein
MTRTYKPRGFKYPDPIEHEQHIAWLRAKAQAAYRLEDWELTLPEFMKIWGRKKWLNRGRASDALAMARIDWFKPWSKDNVKIMTRCEQVNIANRKHYERREQQRKSLRGL